MKPRPTNFYNSYAEMNTTSILKKLQSEPLHRNFSIDRGSVKDGSRTVDLAFATNRPIQHWFGKLKLSMNSKAMRNERLKSGAALLVDHDWKDVVGVVEKHSIGADGVARATVRFGESVRATEIFQDVQTGIRQNVSVGFLIHSLEMENDGKAGDGIPIYRSDDWEPFEISIVSVPADIKAGIGRSTNNAGDRENIMGNLETQTLAERTQEIVAFANVFGESELAQTMLAASPNVSLEDVRQAIKAKRDAITQPSIPKMDPHAAAWWAGNRQYEPARSIPRYERLRSFEGEAAEMRAFRFGQWILAGPCGNNAARIWCQSNGVNLSRAMNEAVNEKGGYLVPEEFGSDIVKLMERYGVIRQNAHIVPMSSDRRSDPVLNGELDSQFVGEYEEGNDQELDVGSIGYTARKHMVLVPYTSELSEDAAISIADEIADKAARAFAKKEDSCGFNADGTSTYGGMVGIREALKGVDNTIGNIQGLQVGTGNLYSELALIDFEGVVGRLPDFADIGNAKWYVSRKFYFNVMVKLLLSSAPTATEIEDARNRKFLGYPVVFSQVMPSTEANSQVCAIFGDLSQGARLADRRGITIAIDDSTLFRKDALLFRATARFDFNASFGVGDNTAAGPICGLITAAA